MPRKPVPSKARASVARWTPPPIVEETPADKVVSYSELDTFRQCPLKHLLSYRERWTKAPDEDSPLTKGTLWHAVMEAHYLAIQAYQHDGETKPGFEVMIDRISREVGALLWDGSEQSPNQELVWWMYQGYVAKYGYDPDWEILGVEVKFQCRLVGPHGPSPFLLKGKLDLVVRDRKTGKIWIIDHKSGANLPNMMELDIDDQFGLYCWLLRESGIQVLGVIHSAARTTMNAGDRPENQDEDGNPIKRTMAKQTLDQRFHRTLLSRGEKELDSIGRDAWAVATNAYPEIGINEVRAGRTSIPLYTSPDTRSCGWKCDFLDAHLMARKGREIRSVLTEQGFEQRFERH